MRLNEHASHLPHDERATIAITSKKGAPLILEEQGGIAMHKNQSKV